MYRQIIIALLLISPLAYPCTTFVLKTPTDLVFGRNLDWVSDNGIIVTNPRNVEKESLVFPPDKPVRWTSKYGSITFNQFGKEFPFGGMNEQGLVIEIMRAPADYPDFDNRKAVNELQWIQYQLDNAATIDDIIENDKNVRLSHINQQLHFLVCDKNGNVAVLEFRNKKMVVYKDGDLPHPVLENSTYRQSLANYKNNKTSRFTTAAKMVRDYKASPNASAVDYSFNILKKVALDASWSIVYDIKNMQIHYNTASHRAIKTVDFKSFTFDCNKVPKAFDLLDNRKGNVTNLFVDLSTELNHEKMSNAFITNTISFPETVATRFYNYHKTVVCNAANAQ
jgi:hypothetical protein